MILPRLEALIKQVQDELMVDWGINTQIPPDGGERSIPKQWELFYKGRVYREGLWIPSDPVHHTGIVTNAVPNKAPHCAHFDHDGSKGSAACDLAIVVAGVFAWNVGDLGYDKYPKLGEIGKKYGLCWGGDWPGKLVDLDHFELADWRSLRLAPVSIPYGH